MVDETSNAKKLCTQSEFNRAFTLNGYPEPSPEQFQNFITKASSEGGITCKQELAIFLSHVIYESNGLRNLRQHVKPKFHFTTGIGYSGQSYFGRGYFQLTWDYNYKEASYDLFGNDILLREPDQVASNESISWSSAFWYWKKKVMMSIFAENIKKGYFGASTNAINGNTECQGAFQDLGRKRYKLYKNVLRAFNITSYPIENGCYN